MRSPVLTLLFFIGLIAAYHNWGYFGHFGYDDLHYAKLALHFTNGSLDYSDHYAFRTTIIALTALSYGLFGMSDFSSALPALAVSIAILALVYALLKEKGTLTLVAGLALTTLPKWFIFYADKLMPDIYVALGLLGALYAIHEYRYNSRQNNPARFSLGLVLALLWGFMSKETIALALPLFIYYVAADLLQQKHIRFWIYSALGGFIVLAIYFLVVWALTGDVLKRFDAIAGNSYLNLCSYDQQPLEFLVQRITSGFFTLLVREGMATSFILIIAHLVRRRSLRFLSMDDSFSFWATSALILLLSSNFMSISLTSYSPMCLDPRHYLFLIPVAAIPAAMAFRDFITHRPYALSALLFMTLTAAIAYNLPEKSFWQLYAPLALLFLLMWLTGAKPSFQHPYLALFVLLLSIQPIYTANYARRINYPRQREVFMEQVLNKPDSAIVITDDIQKRLGQYYAAFSSNSRHTLLNFEEFKYDSTDRRKKILFLNGHTRFMANIADDQKLPLYAQNMSASNPLLYQDTALNIAIYDMRRFTIPEQNGKRLLYSINDFEQAAPYWSQEGHPTSAEVKYQGAYAGQASEFSATFAYPADSLRLSGFSHLLIRCSAFVNHTKATPAQLVISIEDNTGAYIWKGAAVNPSIRAFSNWWPITHELSLPQSDIKENATLKVYFWNPDKQKAYIDNFWVEVIGYDD